MSKNEKVHRFLEWLLQELAGELARIQKEKADQEEFLMDMMDAIQRMLD